MSAYQGARLARRKTEYRREECSLPQFLGHALFFPVLFLYLELVLHIYMGAGFRFIPIYLTFALSMGFAFSAITMVFPYRVNSVLSKVLSVMVSVIYIVEIIAKKILQSYYPFSSLGVAAGNRLTDYADVIFSTVIRSIPVILVLLLPSILYIVLGERLLGARC